MMKQLGLAAIALFTISLPTVARADAILDWNATIRQVIQANATHANPGDGDHQRRDVRRADGVRLQRPAGAARKN